MIVSFYFKKVSNPNNKVLLHWAAEHPRRKQESILMMYDIQPLKYELRQPETDTSTEYWPSGKINLINILINKFTLKTYEKMDIFMVFINASYSLLTIILL